jgi:hypothetical protein
MAARPHPRQRLIENLEHGKDRLRAEQAPDGGEIDAEAIPLEEQRRATADARHEAIAEGREELLEDAAGISAASEALIESSERCGGIAVGDRAEEGADPLLAAGADDGMDIIDTDRAAARAEAFDKER